MATPILYRTLELNKALLSPHAADTYPGLYENIQRYTLEAVVASDLEPSGVRRVISWASRLQSIRYAIPEPPLLLLNTFHHRLETPFNSRALLIDGTTHPHPISKHPPAGSYKTL